MEELTLHASREQFKTFMDSPVWHDMIREVQAWLDDIRNQLEQSNNIEISRRLQGNAEACRYFLSLPHSLIEAMEEMYGKPN